jgi:hypothetical protein
VRNNYTLTSEPGKSIYDQLIDYSLDYCTIFLLVTRHSISVSKSAKDVLDRLQSFLFYQQEEASWPGTELLEGTATVYRYRLTPESASILTDVADGLFSWTQPQLPEDLILIRDDGSPLLVSISHEKDGYLELSTEERSDLISRIPDIAAILEHTPDKYENNAN